MGIGKRIDRVKEGHVFILSTYSGDKKRTITLYNRFIRGPFVVGRVWINEERRKGEIEISQYGDGEEIIYISGHDVFTLDEDTGLE